MAKRSAVDDSAGLEYGMGKSKQHHWGDGRSWFVVRAAQRDNRSCPEVSLGVRLGHRRPGHLAHVPGLEHRGVTIGRTSEVGVLAVVLAVALGIGLHTTRKP